MALGPRRRAGGHRPLGRRILVVTEGTCTEPQYVQRLDAHLRGEGVATTVKTVGVGKDPMRVVERCIREREDAALRGKGFDECFYLVDVDEHATLSQATALAERAGIHVLTSNRKFEVWLRWHAEDRRSALSSSQLDETVTTLDLARGKLLAPQFPFDEVSQACAIARSVDPDMRPGRKGPDPSSAMPILVDVMRGASETAGRERPK